MSTLDTVTEDFLFSNKSWISSLIPSFKCISFERQDDGSFHYLFEDAILALGDKCIAFTKKGDACKNNIKENLKCNRHQKYEPTVQKQVRVQISDCDSILRPIPATVSWQDVLINGENVVKKDGTFIHMPVSAVWDATIVRLKTMIQVPNEHVIKTDDGIQYDVDPLWTVDQFISIKSPSCLFVNGKKLMSGYFMQDYL